jgi:hypothetical protein
MRSGSSPLCLRSRNRYVNVSCLRRQHVLRAHRKLLIQASPRYEMDSAAGRLHRHRRLARKAKTLPQFPHLTRPPRDGDSQVTYTKYVHEVINYVSSPLLPLYRAFT